MALSKTKIENNQGIRARNLHLIDAIYRCGSCESLQHHPKQFYCCGARLCRFCATITLPDSLVSIFIWFVHYLYDFHI